MNVMVQRIEPVAMRRTLGRFTTGVTVVTTANGGDVHAMTANAFTSVSLDPPLVLVSVDHRTRMHALLPDTRRYGVSVLGSDQERVAWHFAGRPLRDAGELFEWAGEVPVVRGGIADVGGRLPAGPAAGDPPLVLARGGFPHSRPGDPLVFPAGPFGRLSPEEQMLAH